MLTIKQQQDIAKKFEGVKRLADARSKELFGVLDRCTEEEKICMQYLFAYMPISDLANYEGELFLRFVKQALKVRKLMPWGDKLEDTDFLNYVLQYRINNENIEFFSEGFFEEIYPRIKGLDMYEAAITVNYWCFEKATYQTTDARTASPFTVLRNAYGRCGEESTLTVAALRSVGIPARQCYTPRWAHCDDNHAWVEVWIDGKWNFLGACEPEIKLNTGWFMLPASRGMLIHNRVFSDLVEGEVITCKTPRFTEINILKHYAKTKEMTVKVVDCTGAALKGVEVSFEIVNYAELYSLATLKTNEVGEVTFVTGLGDMVVFAHDKKNYTYKKVDVRINNKIELILTDDLKETTGTVDFSLVPPVGGVKEERKLSEEQEKLQKQRNAEAENKRKVFEGTFYTQERAIEYAKKYGSSQLEVAKLLENARGNYPQIIAFLENEETKTYFDYKVLLLKSLNKKDLTDSTLEVLKDHLIAAMPYHKDYDKDIFINYILCPRVDFEMITAYRKAIMASFKEEEKQDFKANPKMLYHTIHEWIKEYNDMEYPTLSAMPMGLLALKVGNELSKKILFVTICRTLGIPARIEKSDGVVEYYEKDKWVSLTARLDESHLRTATLTLKKTREVSFDYYKNYSLALLKDAQYITLELEYKKWENDSITYQVKAGTYRVITANRQADGTLLNRFYFVQIADYEHKELTLELVEGKAQTREVLIDDALVKMLDQKEVRLSQVLGENHNIVAWLDLGAEPTEHLLNEIIESKDKFNALKPTVVLILKKAEDRDNPTLVKVLKEVPFIKVVIGQEELSTVDKLYDAFDIKDKKLPLAILVEEGQTATYAWAGYNVGIGEMLLKNLKR